MASRSVSRAAAEAAIEEEVAAGAGEAFVVNPIEKIQALGVNASDITKLKDYGLATTKDVLGTTSKRLLTIKGMSEAKMEKVVAACEQLENMAFMTAGEALAYRHATVMRITTGSKALDEMLGGGVETQALLEIFGESRMGKSQLCHTLCVTSQLPSTDGGGEGKAIYVDTEGKFRPERLAEIAVRWNLDPEAVLNNVLYMRAPTHEAQMKVAKSLSKYITDDPDPYRVVIFDSVTGLFRSEHNGRGELQERQSKLNNHLQDLKKLAENHNIAMVMVNQVTADPGAMSVVPVGPKPIGGNILAHASTTRLFMKKGRGMQRVCKLYNSPTAAELDCCVELTAGGVADAE